MYGDVQELSSNQHPESPSVPSEIGRSLILNNQHPFRCAILQHGRRLGSDDPPVAAGHPLSSMHQALAGFERVPCKSACSAEYLEMLGEPTWWFRQAHRGYTSVATYMYLLNQRLLDNSNYRSP
jgi:hypothetical protein